MASRANSTKYILSEKSRKIFGFVFFSCYFLFGIFLLHRGTLKYADMQTFTGKVLSKGIVRIQSGKGSSYTLAIKTDSLPYYLGVHYWSKSEAYSSKVIDSIQIGEFYTFYLNPTFPISNGLNSGVSKITSGGKTVFEEPEKGNNLIATFLIISGLAGIFYAIKGKKLQK